MQYINYSKLIIYCGYKMKKILNNIWSYLWSNYISAVIARQQLASFHVQYIMTDSFSQDIIKFYLCFINDNVRNFALKNYSITTLAPAVGCFIPRCFGSVFTATVQQQSVVCFLGSFTIRFTHHPSTHYHHSDLFCKVF